MISPIFEKLSDTDEFANVECYKVDVDEQEQIAADASIKAVRLCLRLVCGIEAFTPDAYLHLIQRW